MKTINVNEVEGLGSAQEELLIIDIRSADEYKREHIKNSVNIPADKLNSVETSLWADKAILFHCKSGNRTNQAKAILEKVPCQEKYCLSGGIDQWKKHGYPVVKNNSAPLELMRQVQIIVSLIILLGVALAIFFSPYFLIIPVFVSLGLLTAGITGFCGMAKLLMLIPYNKPKN